MTREELEHIIRASGDITDQYEFIIVGSQSILGSVPRPEQVFTVSMEADTGTIVDATIIGAPSSTKNADKQRDPEMHQTRKGQQWYFGMKLHIGVDSRTGLAHSAVVTAANVHDKHPLPDLLHGNEQRVYGDSAYASQKALIGSKAPKGPGLHQPARAQGRRDRRG